MAITTFRRCSDLQALRIDEHLKRIQEQGITFIRHGLAKQDREKHFREFTGRSGRPQREMWRLLGEVNCK